MQVAVISDLHLGTGGPTDLFGHDDGEFLRFLGFLESNFERIVLLGDIWETLTAATPRGQLAELRAAQDHHREIFRRFQAPQYRYVHGNHDLIAGRVDAIPSEYALEANGVRLLFSHGHQGDRLCNRARFLSELGVWMGGWLRRWGLQPIYAYFAGIEGRRASVLERCAVRSWALSHAQHRAVDIVVTGHTHVPAKAETARTIFLNSGTCAAGNISFLSLDTRQGTYEVNATY